MNLHQVEFKKEETEMKQFGKMNVLQVLLNSKFPY